MYINTLSDSHQQRLVLTLNPTLHPLCILSWEVCKLTHCRFSLAAHFHRGLTSGEHKSTYKKKLQTSNLTEIWRFSCGNAVETRWRFSPFVPPFCIYVCSVIICLTLKASRSTSLNLFSPHCNSQWQSYRTLLSTFARSFALKSSEYKLLLVLSTAPGKSWTAPKIKNKARIVFQYILEILNSFLIYCMVVDGFIPVTYAPTGLLLALNEPLQGITVNDCWGQSFHGLLTACKSSDLHCHTF